ncbi:FAD-dependent oxidoreductase [Nesterenkonia haasae]|uniref:FAD-dependent oxidoreductase n=1 Tax=Nesterenkonia haasae TaxID=2587813 RepID=UPI0013917A81|nr:FAD-dependent oxidoreductase [Nesterenkonia haasae]NDK32581.1 FAD-dependent oxidoreductase [Nesterenkonia haasae]
MNTAIREPARSTPVVGEYDVIVVGGGPAGLMAATTASRTGRSTLMVERYGFLGGAGTMGGLSTFCGLHARVHGEHKRVVRGYCDELIERLEHMNAISKPHFSVQNRIQAQAYDISAYKVALDELLLKGGTEILFHASVVGLTTNNEQQIDTVIVESKSGREAIRGRVFIDGSGDADLAHLAGAPIEKSPDLLYPSLMFRINGVDYNEAGEAWRTVARLMEEAEARGEQKFPRKKPIVRPQRNPLEWRSNLTQLSNDDGSAIDGTDVRQLTKGELQGRQQVWEVFDFVKRRTPGFENSYIVDIAPQVGIRETRRTVGVYQLSEDDILSCVNFDDAIGVQGWPVEAHVKGTVEFRFPHADEQSRGFNQLPYRMLVPQQVENLLTVGRSASMTQGGQSSARVTGPCFVMGQAAGIAADIALSEAAGVADVEIPVLQRRLQETGAYLGADLAPDTFKESPPTVPAV